MVSEFPDLPSATSLAGLGSERTAVPAGMSSRGRQAESWWSSRAWRLPEPAPALMRGVRERLVSGQAGEGRLDTD